MFAAAVNEKHVPYLPNGNMISPVTPSIISDRRAHINSLAGHGHILENDIRTLFLLLFL